MYVQTMKRNMNNEKGLTLIELLAVIVILGIIAAIAIPAIGNVIQKSQVDAVKADAMQAINAAKLYVASNGTEEKTLTTDNQLEPYLDELRKDSSFTVTLSVDEKGHVTYKVKGSGMAGSKKVKIEPSKTLEELREMDWKDLLS